jgi:hypothetical protein
MAALDNDIHQRALNDHDLLITLYGDMGYFSRKFQEYESNLEKMNTQLEKLNAEISTLRDWKNRCVGAIALLLLILGWIAGGMT